MPLSKEKIMESERWGRNIDGYTAGGCFDDNPDLK
jgi:hypothetical protein